jgi:hypothetical protein
MSDYYVNHPLHIILCLLTGGLWLIVYIPLLLKQGEVRKQRR